MNTGAASKGPTSARLGPKLRDIADRTRTLEQRRAKVVRVGDWALRQNSRGDLVAVNPSTGAEWTIAMANRPEETH